MNCNLCKQTRTKNKDIFKCDGCNLAICKECGNLTASEVKVLQLSSSRAMRFYCPKCLNGESLELIQKLLSSQKTIIEDKIMIISLLQEEIEKLKTNTKPEQYGYSNAVKKQNKEVIIVKPKDSHQSSENTKKAIEEKIDPCSLGEGIGVSKLKYIREGGVAIKYNEDGNKNVQKVCDNIKSSLGQGYEVKVPEKKNPRIVIFNIHSKELEDEDGLINKLITQNTINTEPSIREIKIVHKYQSRKGMINVIFQVDKQSYECIRRKEKISIGWKACFYKDSLNVRQCFNCWKFGHIAKDCKNTKPTCQVCAGEHQEKDCRSRNVCCVNCKYALEVLKIPNLDCNHRAYDRKCETYKRVIEQLQERINYPEMHNGLNNL